MGIEASIVVSFGDGADGAFSVIEMDNGEDGMNWDATKEAVRTALIGDSRGMYFILQIASGYSITSYKASSGTLTYQGTVTRTKKEQMTFLDSTTENEFGYIPRATPSITKAYTESGSSSALTFESDNRKCTAPAITKPLVADVSATATFHLFKLVPPTVTLAANETWPIACLIVVDPV